MTEAEEDMLRLDVDAQGNRIFTGLTLPESMEVMTYMGAIAGMKKRYSELIAKHETALALRKLDLKNVLPMKRTFF